MVQVREKIENKEKLVQKIQRSLQQLTDSARKNINRTDPESVKAKGRQGTHACYNVQINTDNKHGIIVQAEAMSQNNDLNLLKDQLEKSAENLGKKATTACSDSGYNSTEHLLQIDEEIKLIVPSQQQAQKEKEQYISNPFDKEQFVYDQPRDEDICPEGKRLTYQGLDRKKQLKKYKATAKDCQGRQHFGVCTSSRAGRTMSRHLREDFKRKLENIYASPEGQEIYQLRKQKVEHPFGHMKRNLGAGQFMLRGKTKVDAEFDLINTLQYCSDDNDYRNTSVDHEAQRQLKRNVLNF